MRSTPPDRNPLPDAADRAENLLIRPSIPSDIEDFYELAKLAGAGFTSLPVNETLLAERLSSSANAFAGGPGVLMLALEDRKRRCVVGCAAVKPGGRPRPDFLNFSVQNQTLVPTSSYADMTEVGSLLLHPDYRCHGIGPWLARSRYLLIATDLARFGSVIFSELRGVVDEDDQSPFYNAVCAPFFGCSFAEADSLSAHGRQAELNALLPKDPTPLDGLAFAARDAIARPHHAGRRALDYLEAEGFRFDGVVDLLDGGPAVVAESCAVTTIRQSYETRFRAGPVHPDLAIEAYIAVGHGPDFRCSRARIALDGEGSLRCSQHDLAAIGIMSEGRARVRLVDAPPQTLGALKPPATGSRVAVERDQWANADR